MPGIDDFRALQDLARVAGAEPDWKGFARYCELRASGLRKPALDQLSAFLTKALEWPFEDRRAFCAWLCAQTGAHQSEVIPQPLRARLIVPTLEQWVERYAADPMPHYLLGRFVTSPGGEKPSRVARFEMALQVDPGFEPARLALVDGILAEVEFSQHHLPDGYIGSPAQDLMLLNQAAVLLKSVAGEARVQRSTELDELRRHAEEWRTRA